MQGSNELVKQRSSITAWLLWSTVALFYFYEICLRMLPGIMTKQTMLHFHIDATQLGMFTALYYWSYTIMQIPAGLLVDRFNIRFILCVACSSCVIGFTTSHHTSSLLIAEIGRFIVGLGSAFAYVSCLKVATLWLPKKRFGVASCVLDSLGMLGALFTTTCLLQINLHFSAHTTSTILILGGITITILIGLTLRNANRFVKVSRRQQYRSSTTIMETLTSAVKSKNLWLLGLVGCLSYLPSSVIGDVWGLPYLQSTYHLDKTHASWIIGAFFIAWAIAGPFVGICSDRFQSRRKPIFIGLIILLTSLSVLIYLPTVIPHSASFGIALILFILMGLGTSTHPLIFAMAKEQFSNKMAGTIVACTNMIIMLSGLFFQPLIGFFLDWNHVQTMHHLHYLSGDFTRAFSIIPGCIIIAIVALTMVRCKKKPKKSAYCLPSFSLEIKNFGINFR